MQNELFTYEADGQALIIHLPKELDHHNCRNLKYETDLLMEENYINKIVFDFSNTEFMDSSGIGLVMGRYKLMQAMGGDVTVCGLSPKLEKIVTLSGLSKLIKIERMKSNETNE